MKSKDNCNLIMLGTGHALTTECYNTCFLIEENDNYFLVDTGGGGELLKQLKDVHVDVEQIHDIFISHQHLDHLLGLFYFLRVYGYQMAAGKFKEELRIYAHKELIKTILSVSEKLLDKRVTSEFGKLIKFIKIKDDKSYKIIGHKVVFFDIHSTKMKQFGFKFKISKGKFLVFLGDEPYRETEEKYAKNADWIIHEAMCLQEYEQKYNPHKISHSTVKDACENAQNLKAKNLILVHSQDENYPKRKELFLNEGKQYFSGNLYAPLDLERILLN